MSELVSLRVETHDRIVVAHVSGELDIAGADSTGERIVEAVPNEARGLVVDFSDLEFIDSSGVSMLFAIARKLGGRRQQLRLVAPRGAPVARVLEIVEFDRAAPVHAELDEALADIR